MTQRYFTKDSGRSVNGLRVLEWPAKTLQTLAGTPTDIDRAVLLK